MELVCSPHVVYALGLELMFLAVVWAVDLDNQDSLSAEYLSSGGTMNDTNGFELKKKKLENIQSLGDNLGVWTPCMSEKDRREQGCPAGERSPYP